MVTDPVCGDRFFDRKNIIEHINKRVCSLIEGYRQNIALLGPELIGKTSVIHQFLYEFKSKQLIPIYIDVKNEPFQYFADRFIGVLLYNTLKICGIKVKDDINFLNENAVKIIPKTASLIKKIRDLIKAGDNISAYSLLLDLPFTAHKEIDKCYVVFFDNFHNMLFFNVKNIFSILGKKIMVQKNVMYVMTSSDIKTAKDILNEKLSLLFGNFEILYIEEFGFDATAEFLKTKLKGIKISEPYLDFLIAVTDGKPFYLDVVAKKLSDLVNEEHIDNIDENIIVHMMYDLLFDSTGIFNQYFTNRIDRIFKGKNLNNYIQILAIIANNSSNNIMHISKNLKMTKREVLKHMPYLLEKNIIVKNGSFYTFDDRVLELWIKFVYDIKMSSLSTDFYARQENFKTDVKKWIINFIKESQKDIFSRILKLIQSFDGEVVKIEQRKHRLGSFSNIKKTKDRDCMCCIEAEKEGNFWFFRVFEKKVTENEIEAFNLFCKNNRNKISKKILIYLDGINVDAKILAKETKIWMWNLKNLNKLMHFYGMTKVIKRKDCLREEKTESLLANLQNSLS